MRQPERALTATEARALDAVDEEGLIGFPCELVSIPSLTGGETAAQRRMAEVMRRSGPEVDEREIDLPALRAEGDRGGRRPRRGARRAEPDPQRPRRRGPRRRRRRLDLPALRSRGHE